MEAKAYGIPIENLIQAIESDLEVLTEKHEELSDKGQVVFYISQKIQEKRDELDSLKNFLQMRQRSI